MKFKRIKMAETSCQLSVNLTTNVSRQINFGVFVSCHLFFGSLSVVSEAHSDTTLSLILFLTAKERIAASYELEICHYCFFKQIIIFLQIHLFSPWRTQKALREVGEQETLSEFCTTPSLINYNNVNISPSNPLITGGFD